MVKPFLWIKFMNNLVSFCNPFRTVFCLIENQQFVNSLLPIALNVKAFKLISCSLTCKESLLLIHSRHLLIADIRRVAVCGFVKRRVRSIIDQWQDYVPSSLLSALSIMSFVVCRGTIIHQQQRCPWQDGWDGHLTLDCLSGFRQQWAEIDDTLFIKQITLNEQVVHNVF